MDMTILEPIAISLIEPDLKLPDENIALFYKDMQARHFWLDVQNISWDSVSFLVKYIQYLNRAEADDMTPITLHIMCTGGELSAMFPLYHTIKNSKIPVHTINEGEACSAAFIIFLAGSKRTMSPDARFVAHEGSGGMMGSYRENKSAMQQYERDVTRMAQIIAENTNLSVEEINTKYEQTSDWYIGYDEAKQFGIITE